MNRLLFLFMLLFSGLIQPIMAEDPTVPTTSTISNSATSPETSSLSTPTSATSAAVGTSGADKVVPFALGEMIWIMLLGGLLGGAANYLRTSGQLKPNASNPQLDPAVSAAENNETLLTASVPNKEELGPYLLTCLVLGVAASALVPLFLNSLHSDLLTNRTDINLLIFGGFCLLASISSTSFIDALTQRILNQMKNLRDQTVTEANRAADNKQQTEALKEHTQTLLESVRSEQENLRDQLSTEATGSIAEVLKTDESKHE